jgi:hypothetical protein
MQRKDSAATTDRIEHLKQKLKKTVADFAKSYEVMYRMLEAGINREMSSSHF